MQISAARNPLYFKGLPKRHTLSIVGRARFLSTPLCSIIHDSMQLQGCLVQIKLLQIVNREGSNFVLFLNRTAVLMDQSESVAQHTPGRSSGTDSMTIPPVLTEQDIPVAALNAVN